MCKKECIMIVKDHWRHYRKRNAGGNISVHANEEHNAISRILGLDLEGSENTDVHSEEATDGDKNSNLDLDEEADGNADSRNNDLDVGEDGKNELDNGTDQDLGIDADFEDQAKDNKDINEDGGKNRCHGIDIDNHRDNPENTNLCLHGDDGGNEGLDMNSKGGQQRCEDLESDTRLVASIGESNYGSMNINLDSDQVRQEGSRSRVFAIATRNDTADSKVGRLRTDTERVADGGGCGSGEEAKGKDSSEDGSETHCE